MGVTRLYLHLVRHTPLAATYLKKGPVGEKHTPTCTRRAPALPPCIESSQVLLEEVGSWLQALVHVAKAGCAQHEAGRADEGNMGGLRDACRHCAELLLDTLFRLGPLHNQLHEQQAQQHQLQRAVLVQLALLLPPAAQRQHLQDALLHHLQAQNHNMERHMLQAEQHQHLAHTAQQGPAARADHERKRLAHARAVQDLFKEQQQLTRVTQLPQQTQVRQQCFARVV